ncbi:uncharacterized protein DC041_0009823 [Schistosoma bovis]|uniref:EF-hand domain-containing protein n=1 Tax=Schistosoma bovis TaxID=6184 RepID=A0A430QUD2_SCHBO|nr:uncharacterized protein DC041_0009823 [Schistosoma bovis]
MSSERSRSVRSFLDEKFKPTFDQYDINTGIPSSDLKQFLGKSHLSESKVHNIVDSADKDGDQFITYDEFLKQVSIFKIIV